jgi:hypothetical protein
MMPTFLPSAPIRPNSAGAAATAPEGSTTIFRRSQSSRMAAKIFAREQPLMIEQQMQLHGSFGAPELCPVENRSAELDERGVQSEWFVFETETMRASHFASASDDWREPGAPFSYRA